MNKKVPFSAWICWGVASGFFAFQFILRLFPSLILDDIMSQFQIDAKGIGYISAAYYFGYAGFQIPIGLLLDRFQPRRVISVCAALCGVGVLCFVYSSFWPFAAFGRFLIGVGSAAGFLGTAQTIRLVFPSGWYSVMMGFSVSIGLFGAVNGGKPMNFLMRQFGPSQVLLILAGISFLLSLGVYFLFPDHSMNEEETDTAPPSLKDALLLLVRKPQVLWVGLAGALLVGPFEGFADLWGVSYLSAYHGFNKADASLLVSFIFLGMLIGGPLLSFMIYDTKAPIFF